MHDRLFWGRLAPILRLWLVLTPALPILFAPEGTALLPLALNLAICLGAAFGFALSGVFYFRHSDEHLDLVLGVWIAVSPWALGFAWSPVATWNAVACGLTIAGMSLLLSQREGSA